MTLSKDRRAAIIEALEAADMMANGKILYVPDAVDAPLLTETDTPKGVSYVTEDLLPSDDQEGS